MGQGANPHHNQHHMHHNLPSNSDSYRENIPAAEFQLPHSRELKPPAAKPSVDKKKTLRDIVSPLCASRLKPIRQKTKNAVVRYCSYFMIDLLMFPVRLLMCNFFVLCFLTGEHPGHG